MIGKDKTTRKQGHKQRERKKKRKRKRNEIKKKARYVVESTSCEVVVRSRDFGLWYCCRLLV